MPRSLFEKHDSQVLGLSLFYRTQVSQHQTMVFIWGYRTNTDRYSVSDDEDELLYENHQPRTSVKKGMESHERTIVTKIT